MKLIASLSVFLAMATCSQQPTRIKTDSNNGTVEVINDATVATAPVVSTRNDDVVVTAPPGTTVTVVQSAPSVDAKTPQQEVKRTVIVFPPNAGGEIRTKTQEFNAHGSAGHKPPAPATAFEKSLSVWSYIGAGVFLLGIFFCTPWGGSHYRVGAMISAGGLVMTMLGLFLNEMSQWFKFKMPDWLPSVGFLGIIGAVILYMGWRRGQLASTTEPPTK